MDDLTTSDGGQIVEINDVPFAAVDGITLRLNLRRPEPLPVAPMPIVVYIHGGAWMHNDRTVDRSQFLDGCGFLTASIDYRLSHQAIFPAQLQDAKAAIRWLRARAAEYHADGSRIGVWGHSSGAHLAALLGTTGDLVDKETSAWWDHRAACRPSRESRLPPTLPGWAVGMTLPTRLRHS